MINKLLFVLIFALAGNVAAGETTWRWSGIERVVAFADVHGAYDELVDLLQSVDVIDEELNWVAGQTHLVSMGDLLDRGPHSRKVMDLLIELQTQAGDAGGFVHVLLGNHELMNLTGDMRYVSLQEYAAFADEEPPGARQTAFDEFVRDKQLEAPEDGQIEFDRMHPPGYFGLRAALSPDGLYGRWLLDRPVMIVINRTAFTHGGLPSLVGELGLAQTNRKLRAELHRYVNTWQTLRDMDLVPGYLDTETTASMIEQRLSAISADNPESPELADLAQAIAESSQSDIFDDDGPLWYRGTALCHALLETSITTTALTRLDVDRVVVGHTPTRDRRVTLRLDNKVVLLDTGMLKFYYDGVPSALVLDNDQPTVVYGTDVTEPTDTMTDSVLENLLQEASIEQLDSDKDIVTLRHDEQVLQALLRSERSGREYAYEIAAYRIDRILGLGMVPVTVKRDIDGRSFALSLRDEETINERQRVASGASIPDWCASGNEYDLMYALDALLANEGRTRESMLYFGTDLSLRLVRFGRSFSTLSNLPAYLKNVDLELSPELRKRLAALNANNLSRELGEFISQRQIKALLKRRDKMLNKWSRQRDD